MPKAVVRLCALFADPEYKLGDVVQEVELVPSLREKLLSLANSPIHGAGRVRSTNEVIAWLGSGTVRSIAIATNARPRPDLDLSGFRLTPASYWRHCVAVLSFAEEMAAQRLAKFGDDFSTAALLHDFGKLVLSEHLTSEQRKNLRVQRSGLSAVEYETRELGINHAQVTAVAAHSWNLRDDLVRAVEHHHNSAAFDHPMCHGVNIANQMAWQLYSSPGVLERESENRTASMAALDLTQEQWDLVLEEGTVRLHTAMSVYC